MSLAYKAPILAKELEMTGNDKYSLQKCINQNVKITLFKLS